MVQRLNAEQTAAMLHELARMGFTSLRVPEPVTEDAIVDFGTRLAGCEAGRCYGMFDDWLNLKGGLLGSICPDHQTGLLMGYEHEWWCPPGVNGLPLLQTFEKDCREAGCVRMLCGYSQFSSPERMAKIYKRLGYEPYSTTVSKEL